eukprot:CAMPEP_0170518470 /NCGR_PEP_ID=MMETSP0209-20121228/4154_1 /TAXON_ID=665100 ORGANISM="Litonotus pictus, Strain P1" /NCGR_SAMPLE_ID=MMETSP0209 /ASSEMBLY_ACC=CAM_ASM_000301 /LENGTH=235 /DNA_ID=CAMNT_0010804041 /DNA_START=90 /DNA_END=797 /DNA_ORIENTATION=-
MLAFQTAIDHGIPMIELDIWLTKDSVPVVIHCNYPSECISETVLDGKGKVSEYTLSEIQTFSLGKEQRIPSLEEVFALCKDKIFIDIEIKETVQKEAIMQETLKLIDKYCNRDQVLICGFDFTYYHLLRKYCDDIEFKFLMHERKEIEDFISKEAKICRMSSVGVFEEILTEKDISLFRSFGLPVSIYTTVENNVFSEERLQKVLKMGVDHFVVDHPKEVQELLKKCLSAKEHES